MSFDSNASFTQGGVFSAELYWRGVARVEQAVVASYAALEDGEEAKTWALVLVRRTRSL